MDEIKSVSEYINFLDGLESLYPMQRYVVPSTFFRGQANKDWKLSPKLYREGMLEKEGIMIQEILHNYPEEFNTDRFNILAKLQHFGFPTRLLDVSANPLVALYFACSGNRELDNDGVVYIFPNPDKPEQFILYIAPLCYSKEKGGFPLCYLRINTLIKFMASLPVMTA